MSRQSPSLFFPTGRDDSPGLMSQIFFPLNVRQLDTQDQDILDRLARIFGLTLLGNRVELTFVGHADFRGDPAYNFELASDRAKSVKGYVDRLLSSNRLYSSVEVVSKGESNAAQPVVRRDGSFSSTPSANQMDFDRRVEVFSSYIPRAVFVPPLVVTVPMPTVRRITFRRYVERQHEGTNVVEPPDFRREDERELIRMIVSGTLLSNEPMGEEDVRARRVAQIPVIHRVNSVLHELEVRTTVDPTVTLTTITTDITYQWGVPQRFVRLEKRYTAISRRGSFRHDPEVRFIPRERADIFEFLFPPNPR